MHSFFFHFLQPINMINKLKNIIGILLIASFILPVSATAQSLSSSDTANVHFLNARKFYIYKVEKGETLFGISLFIFCWGFFSFSSHAFCVQHVAIFAPDSNRTKQEEKSLPALPHETPFRMRGGGSLRELHLLVVPFFADG